jgi:hypothetical protein
MKQALAFTLALGLAACNGDKAKTAALGDSAAPKAVAMAPLLAAQPAKPDPDKELAQRVARAIEGAKLHGVDVVAAAGVVTLWGTAPSARARSRAAAVAGKVEGVKAIDNKLQIVAGS